MKDEKYKIENKILKLSLGGTIAFTLLEIIASFLLGSKTVMTDGIFDLFDLLLLLPMFVLVPFLYKPVSEKKPYGCSQIESLLVLIKYVVLLIVDALLIKYIISDYHIDTIVDVDNGMSICGMVMFGVTIIIGMYIRSKLGEYGMEDMFSINAMCYIGFVYSLVLQIFSRLIIKSQLEDE